MNILDVAPMDYNGSWIGSTAEDEQSEYLGRLANEWLELSYRQDETKDAYVNGELSEEEFSSIMSDLDRQLELVEAQVYQ